MKRKFYIHIGYPKTGTTTLQKTGFFSSFNNCCYLGKPFANPEIAPLIRNFLNGKRTDYRYIQKIVKTLESELAIVAKNSKKIIISIESIFGYYQYGKSNFDTIVKFLELFDDKEIIITVRKQDSLILSNYNQLYAKTLCYSQKHFNNWLEKLLAGKVEEFRLSTLSYYEICKLFESANFKTENLHFIPCEAINNKDRILKIFSHILNENVKKEWSPSVKNASAHNVKNVNVYLYLYSKFRRYFFPSYKISSFLPIKISHILIKLQRKQLKPVMLSKQQRTKIKEFFSESNKKFLELYPKNFKNLAHLYTTTSTNPNEQE